MFVRLFVTAAALTVAAFAAATEQVDSIAAVVNDDVITRGEVRREAAFLARQAEQGDVEAPDGVGERDALDVLIERRVQLQEARRWGITVSENAAARRRADAREQLGAADDGELYQIAAELWGLTRREYERRLREELAMESLFYRRVYLEGVITRGEVDEFLQNEGGLFMGARYRFRHILIAAGAGDSDIGAKEDKAEALRDEVLDGADFAEVAARESDGNFAKNGGDLGMRKDTDLPDIFIEAAREMSAGDVSEVLQSPRGFHIIKLEERQSGPEEDAEQIRLSHLFLPSAEAELARELRGRVDNGENFNDLIKAHTIDERSADQNGDLGWFTADTIPPYFAGAVARMGEGEISDPVESPFGWHILRLDKRETRRLDIEALRDRAARVLREQRALEKRGEWLRGLRERAYISIRAPELAPDGGAELN